MSRRRGASGSADRRRFRLACARLGRTRSRRRPTRPWPRPPQLSCDDAFERPPYSCEAVLIAASLIEAERRDRECLTARDEEGEGLIVLFVDFARLVHLADGDDRALLLILDH